MCECEVIWKDIEGYPTYRISSKGDVYSKYKKSNLAHSIEKRGYHRVTLFKKNTRNYFSVYRLIAIHFIPNPENKPTVDHIDRDKHNNCVCNLRWANQSEQVYNQKSKSKYKNIQLTKYKKWRLSMRINGKKKYFGSFDCLELAIDIRDWYYEHILEREIVE